jgi:YQGE family putative transporter
MLYAMILPVIEIFVGAYIMRNTGNSSFVALYQLCMYIGIVLTAIINGSLIKYFKAEIIYGLGIILSAIILIFMMSLSSINVIKLIIAGFILGISTGFFWTNRYLLTLNATNNDNRNYFFGFESFFFSLWNIIVPLFVGYFLISIERKKISGTILSINNGYQIIAILTLIIAICACKSLSKGNFNNPIQKKFFFIKFHILWKKLLTLSCLKGLVQGFLGTAPAILVMKLVGNEGSLGLMQGIGGALTAILVYVLGRITKPKHRIHIFGFGLLVFFIGTLFNCILFSAIGVIIFVLCKSLFQPLHDLAYFPIMMKTIDAVSKIEKRNEYAYIMTHEIGLFIGRALGLILYILLAHFISEIFALRYALVIVGSLQLISFPLAKNIIYEIDNKYSLKESNECNEIKINILDDEINI